jgi:hypothetical protein
MAIDRRVHQGDCLNSIADETGFFWETLWNHASNDSLKQQRRDPNVLEPGDVVHVPDKTPKQESGRGRTACTRPEIELAGSAGPTGSEG